MTGFWREQTKRVTRSSGWSKVRSTALLRDGKQCTACRKRSNLQAHHVEPFHLTPALELDINNVVTLCGRCHLLLGHLDNWKSYNAKVKADTAIVRARIKERP